MIVEVRNSKVDDIRIIAENMRVDDVNEIKASHGMQPINALKISCALSVYLRTGTIDGVPFCLFGVTPESALSMIGCPWLLGTDRVKDVSRQFLRYNKILLPEMAKGFTRLENWVDSRNSLSVSWLKWLGFAIMPPEPFGVNGLPFHRFYKEF